MLTPNPAYTRELMQIVNTSPYPRHMVMRMAAIAIDRAEIALVIMK